MNFKLNRFQGTSKHIEVFVTSRLAASDYHWNFRLSGDCEHDFEEYRGDELHELKGLFDRVLRYMMNAMKQWSSSEGPRRTPC